MLPKKFKILPAPLISARCLLLCSFTVLTIFYPKLLRAQVIDTAAQHKTVDSLFDVAYDYYIKGDYKNVLAKSNLLAAIITDAFGRNSAEYAECLDYLGLAKMKSGDLKGAEPDFLECEQIRRRVLGLDSPHYATSLHNLGLLYGKMGRYAEAENYSLQAKDIRKRVQGIAHVDYAGCINNLAVLYFDMGRYREAEPLMLEAKAIREKSLGREHPSYVGSVYNLAGLYQRMSRFAEAEPLYLEGRLLDEKAYGKGHPEYARSLNNLAWFNLSMGRIAESEQLMMEAKAMWEKAHGTEHPDYASSLNNLATLYFYNGDIAKAETYLLEAVKIFEKTSGREHPLYARALNNLAGLYFHGGRYAEAEPRYLEAKNLREKMLGRQHPDLAISLHSLANLSTAMGRYGDAVTLFTECLHIREQAYGRNHADYGKALYDIAAAYAGMNRLELLDSVLTQAQALQQLSLTKATTYLSESELTKYVAKPLDQVNKTLSFLHARQSSAGQLAAIAFNDALFYKGFLLQSAAVIRSRIMADTASARRFEMFAGYRRRLGQEYNKPVAGRNQEILNDIEPRANALEKELAQLVGNYEQAYRIVHWQEIRTRLRPGEAVVEFVHFRYHDARARTTDSILYAALVLLPTDTAPRYVPLFEQKALVALLNPSGLEEQSIIKNLYGNQADFLRLFWVPLEPFLHDVQTVLYVPSGLLHRINPAALLDEHGVCISANRQWVRLGSTRELVSGQLADDSFAQSMDKSASTALLIGGVRYDMDSLAFVATNALEPLTEAGRASVRKDGNFRYFVEQQAGGRRGGSPGLWGYLPGTEQEVDAIEAQLLQAGYRIEVKKGLSASEERIKQLGKNAPSPRILHLATHGFAYPDPVKAAITGFGTAEPVHQTLQDPMLRSGLLLAGSNFYWENKRPLTGREDGVFVADEAKDLNLQNTTLVVLSACQTGLGDVVGSEGVYGLQRAFRIAGAKFLLVSLWHVPDQQTREMMQDFYYHWLFKKESLRDAFSHAQAGMRARYPNPYLWAGFVLIE